MPRLRLAALLLLSACGDKETEGSTTPANSDSGQDATGSVGSAGTDSDDTGEDPSADRDGDGVSPADGDCDDTDPAVNPDATEVDWDGLDNDCDGRRGHPAVHLAIGRHHACALDASGQAYCWGSDLDGQASPPAGTFVALAANDTATCGVDAAGQVTCWGRPFVVPHIDLNTWVRDYHGVADGLVDLFWMGGTELCGVTPAEQVYCVGQVTAYVVFGSEEGTTGHSAVGDWVLLTSAGELSGFGAISGMFQLSCEGDAGHRGQGTWERWAGLAAIHGGFEHQCTRGTDGTLDCWGCLNGSVITPPAGSFVDSASGDEHACAVDSAGAVACWGRDAEGQASPPEGVQLASVVAGGNLSCGLQVDQEVVCWGDAAAGGTEVP